MYDDAAGTPGTVIARRVVHGTAPPLQGSFHLILSKPLDLAPGTYWLSVRASMDFLTAGQWGWLTTETASGAPGLWRNPGDGFGTGCTTYRGVQSCILAEGLGPGFGFSVNRSPY